jgi:hypothetical protein
MERANYFHDGYTQDGFIVAVPLMHGSLRFTYRPALVEERSQLSEAATRLRAHIYDGHVARFAAQKIVVWDLVDAHLREVPISAEALLRLQPELFVKLHRIVLGWTPSDMDPEWSPNTRERAAEEEAAAALSGRLVGDVRLEHDEKN